MFKPPFDSVSAAGEDKSEPVSTKSSQENETNDASPEQPDCSPADNDNHNRPETPQEASGNNTSASGSQEEDVVMSDAGISSQVESIKLLFVDRTENYGIPQLERLYTRVMKGVFEEAKGGGGGGDVGEEVGGEEDPKPSILKFLLKFANDEANF